MKKDRNMVKKHLLIVGIATLRPAFGYPYFAGRSMPLVGVTIVFCLVDVNQLLALREYMNPQKVLPPLHKSVSHPKHFLIVIFRKLL